MTIINDLINMKIRYYPKLSKILLITLFLFNFLHCEKDEHPIPDVLVNFDINLNRADYSDLATPGGSVAVTGGWAGIIVYFNGTSYEADRKSVV